MPGQLVCAWCNKTKKNVQLVTGAKSHGICPACVKRVFGLSVQEMYLAAIRREEDLTIAKAKKRAKRRKARERKARHVR